MTLRSDKRPTISPPPPTSLRHKGKVLILGGTAESRVLAGMLLKAGYAPVTSLAGVTRDPARIEGETRLGGFGGADGLARYLAAERFSGLVDATHPFAVAISHHARDAAECCGLPLVRLERPAWHAAADDRWIDVPDIEAAVAAIPPEAHILLTIGRKEILPFLARTDISGIARMIEPPEPYPFGSQGSEWVKGLGHKYSAALPNRQSRATLAGSAVDTEVTGNWRIMLERPPSHVEKEFGLLKDNSITHLVTKNSGGEETRAKLVAARMRGIPVVMIARPAKPEVATVGDPQAVLAFLDQWVSA